MHKLANFFRAFFSCLKKWKKKRKKKDMKLPPRIPNPTNRDINQGKKKKKRKETPYHEMRLFIFAVLNVCAASKIRRAKFSAIISYGMAGEINEFSIDRKLLKQFI